MYAAANTPQFRTYQPIVENSSTAESLAAKALLALTCAYLMVNTMGVVTPELLEQKWATSNWGVSYRHPIKNMEHSGKATEPSLAIEPDATQNLSRIRAVLKPTVLDLAAFFGVSRQTIYDWQSGANPNTEALKKLARMAQAADIFAAANVLVNAQTFKRKVTGGGTLLDAVLTGDNAVQVAHKLVVTLQREASQRQYLSKKFAGREQYSTNVANYGAPRLVEEL